MSGHGEAMTGAPTTPAMKLTPSLRRILERLERKSPTLLSLILAVGGSAPDHVRALIDAGYCIIVDHPTVVDRRRPDRRPAEAIAITPAGIAALGKGKP